MTLRRPSATNALARALGHDTGDIEEIRNSLLLRLIGVGLITVILTIWQAPKLVQASRSGSWPQVNASVAAATNYRQGRLVDLRYVVAGQTYTLEGEHGEADWSVGRQVPVFYDPANPAIARRSAGWGDGDTAGLAVLGALWVLTAGLVGVAVRRFQLASRGVLEVDD